MIVIKLSLNTCKYIPNEKIINKYVIEFKTNSRFVSFMVASAAISLDRKFDMCSETKRFSFLLRKKNVMPFSHSARKSRLYKMHQKNKQKLNCLRDLLSCHLLSFLVFVFKQIFLYKKSNKQVTIPLLKLSIEKLFLFIHCKYTTPLLQYPPNKLYNKR